jgi:S-DNA-T family DNA segregation ATPase FtsK/SpoIIIE
VPRVLTVSEVRQAIYEAAGRSSGSGAPSTATLGRLFHQCFKDLTGPDLTRNLVGPLELADRDLDAWNQQLCEHAYLRCVGPQLVDHHADLQGAGAEVLSYWDAVEHLCRWLSTVIWKQSLPAQAIEEVRRFLFAHTEFECEARLEDPSWHDDVIVEGRVDAVFRQPDTARLCAVELKLGQTSPEADLAQACLYHLLLTAAPGREISPPSHIALLTFQPEAHERMWTAAQLEDAQARLKALIGRLAGVVTEARPEPPEGAHPPVSVLPPPGLDELKRQLIAVFQEFSRPIRLDGEPLVGPAFLRFRVTPSRGVKTSEILGMAQTLWTRLKTPHPPLITVERGRIAVDVQRHDPQVIRWSMAPQENGRKPPRDCSRFPVGVSIEGEWKRVDLAQPEHAHLLVAGTTGSGKSAWLRSLIGSLCATNDPTTLRLVLIDPKRTAFSTLRGSPFLHRPLVHPIDAPIVPVLDDLVHEMEERYARFERAGVEDLLSYTLRQPSPLPRIVCICDEYADLVLVDSRTRKEVEPRVGRLGAKGRAAGIHLVLATQKPSRDVIGGVIKANLNARLAFKVVAPIESRIILDQAGAEALLGAGDFLFKDLGRPIRLQAPLISEDELKRAAQAQ